MTQAKEKEMAGIKSAPDAPNPCWVTVRQIGLTQILVDIGRTDGCYLSAEGARTLARQLYRLARRTDKLNEILSTEHLPAAPRRTG